MLVGREYKLLRYKDTKICVLDLHLYHYKHFVISIKFVIVKKIAHELTSKKILIVCL